MGLWVRRTGAYEDWKNEVKGKWDISINWGYMALKET